MSKLNLALPLQEYQQPEPKPRFRLIQGGLCRHKPESDDLRGERAVVDRSLEFKRWLALFFIEQGKYKVTEKGYVELAPQEIRQDDHIGEPSSARERSSRGDVIRPLTRSEIKEAVAIKVEEMIREGKAEELYNAGHIDRPFHLGWQIKETRITVVKKLLEFLGASPARLDELRKELDELIMQSLREDKTNTKKMQEIVDEIRRNLERIRRISAGDFYNNGLGGLLVNNYKNSPYLALVEAGYVYSEDAIKEHGKMGEFKTDKLYLWEMSISPRGCYEESAATKWLLWKLQKGPKEITYDDFNNNGLKGLLNYHKGSPYLALVDADYAYSIKETLEHARTGEFKSEKIYPWEMNMSPMWLYENQDNRIAAIKWLVWKLKKEPKEITANDFNNNGLKGLINNFKGSPYLALLEANLVTPADESYMRSSGHTR